MTVFPPWEKALYGDQRTAGVILPSVGLGKGKTGGKEEKRVNKKIQEEFQERIAGIVLHFGRCCWSNSPHFLHTRHTCTEMTGDRKRRGRGCLEVERCVHIFKCFHSHESRFLALAHLCAHAHVYTHKHTHTMLQHAQIEEWRLNGILLLLYLWQVILTLGGPR